MADSSAKPPAVLAVGGVMYRFDARGKLQVLLIRKRGGYWTLPKGKLLPDEDHAQALAREIHEETGLSGEVGLTICVISYSIIKRGVSLRKQVTYYLFQTQDGALRLSQDEQIIKAGWFSPSVALKRLQRGRLRVVLRRATSLISGAAGEPPPV
jgi:8-oxo-dGTP pyrophosphatase MutT (NUDIX family)